MEIVAAGKGRINYEAGVVKATGLGALAPPSLSRSLAQNALDARQAALADALRTLSLAVSHVRVSADSRVESYMLKSDDVKLRLDNVVRNAQVIEEALSRAGIYRVVVQVPLTGAGSISEAVGVMDPSGADEETPALGLSSPMPSGADYTGLIVDCRGLDVVSIISPKLYDTDGLEVYGTLKVSADYAIETGIVGYPRSWDAAVRSPRVGEHPLIVRAVRVADEHRFHPVVLREDAERIRGANARDHFLERTAVAFLVDPL